MALVNIRERFKREQIKCGLNVVYENGTLYGLYFVFPIGVTVRKNVKHYAPHEGYFENEFEPLTRLQRGRQYKQQRVGYIFTGKIASDIRPEITIYPVTQNMAPIRQVFSSLAHSRFIVENLWLPFGKQEIL